MYFMIGTYMYICQILILEKLRKYIVDKMYVLYVLQVLFQAWINAIILLDQLSLRKLVRVSTGYCNTLRMHVIVLNNHMQIFLIILYKYFYINIITYILEKTTLKLFFISKYIKLGISIYVLHFLLLFIHMYKICIIKNNIYINVLCMIL